MPPLVLEMPRRAENRQVIAFGPSAGENNLTRFAGPYARDAITGIVEQGTGLPSHMMKAGGVAENLAEIRQHRLADLRGERRGGIVIKVDRAHSELRLGKAVFGP